MAVPVPGPCPPRKTSLRSRSTADARPKRGIVLWAAGALVAAATLAGCEYTYDEGWRPPDAAPAPAVTDQGSSRYDFRNEPVPEAMLDGWVNDALPFTERTVVHSGQGLLMEGQTASDAAAGLQPGTYALALVCRSQRRVTFTVRNDEFTLVDLSLRCGSTRENVIYLSKESSLMFHVEPRSVANFAYRLTRLP